MRAEIVKVEKTVVCPRSESFLSLRGCMNCAYFHMVMTDKEGEEYVLCKYVVEKRHRGE